MILTKIRHYILLLILVVFSTSTSFAYFSKFLNIDKNSREYQLLLSPEDFSLREGGLIASGVSQANLQPYLIQMNNIIKEIKINIVTTDKKEWSSKVFDMLHKTVLKAEKLTASTLDVTLKRGEFNCLTSTLLFNILMEENGIKAQTIIFPSQKDSLTHSLSQLSISTNILDIDTSSPIGFDVANNQLAQQNLYKRIGYTYVNAKKQQELVGKRGLIAYIYANRAYFADKANLPYLAFQNALKAYAIYPQGKYIYTNVVAGLSVYTYYLATDKKDYEKAMEILEEAIQHFPVKKDFIDNYKGVLDLYLNKLVLKAEYEKAFSVFKRAQKVSGTDLKKIRENLFTRLIFRLINQSKDFKTAYIYAEMANRNISFSKNIQSLLVDGLNALAQQQTREWKNYPQGEDLFIKWYNLLKNNKDFRTILESYYSKIGLKFYESGDLKKGMALIDKGISFLPASDVLRNKGAFMTGKTAVDFLKKKDYNYGIYYVKLTLKYLPYDKQMLDNLKISYREWAYSYIDKQKYKTARKIVVQGLIDVPNDTKLLQYKRYIDKKLN